MLRKIWLSLVCLLFLQSTPWAFPVTWNTRSVFVFPECGRTPWLEAIQEAKVCIDMAAYKVSDKQIVDALIAAQQRGVKVRLLLEPHIFTHAASFNASSPISFFKKHDIEIHALSERFSHVHYKLLLVDKKWGLLSTGNLDTESFDSTQPVPAARDFALPLADPALVAEMQRIFDADCQDIRIVPQHPDVVVGPDNQRAHFLAMINGAKKSIKIYQQDIQDHGITAALCGAAQAGVQVQVLMTPLPFSRTEDKNIPNQTLITQSGGEVRLIIAPYIHAKVMLVDDRVLYLGSCNFYSPSLDQGRELGVLAHRKEQIHQLRDVFDQDWEKATPLKVLKTQPLKNKAA